MSYAVVFRLAGPTATWTVQNYVMNMPTDGWPSRSAALGIVGACMGLPRVGKSMEEISHDLEGYAVRIDKPGHRFIDFRVARGWKVTETGNEEPRYVRNGDADNVGNREAIADGAWTCAFLARHESIANRVADAMRDPIWHVSLGSKSNLPSEDLDSQVIETTDIIAAIDDARTTGPKNRDFRHQPAMRQIADFRTPGALIRREHAAGRPRYDLSLVAYVKVNSRRATTRVGAGAQS
ncbi:MAG: hypothetical protein NVSMB14_06070 [Isosphaeraceae bacterium]